MRLKNLFKDLEYIGEAAGDRLSYAVFRGPRPGSPTSAGVAVVGVDLPIWWSLPTAAKDST